MPRLKIKRLLVYTAMFIILYHLINNPIRLFKLSHQKKSSSSPIGIVIVTTEDLLNKYEQHIASLTCYAYRHSYQFIILHPKQYPVCNNIARSIYFQKHCLVSMYLVENVHIEWLLVLDIDVLVLNISKKIESYLPKANTESSIDIIFYERFNGEIMAGNYIIHNRPWSHTFLLSWIEYEYQIANIKFHNNDNGALHIHLLGNMVGNVSQSIYSRCLRTYEAVNDIVSYDTYIGCCKCALGGRWEFQHLRILRRGHSFVRDNLGHDMKKRIWSPMDFLLNDQQQHLDVYYSDKIDIQECDNPKWILPVREDTITTNYAHMKEIIRRFDREAAQAYPHSIGLPDISECWPNCTENEPRRQAFLAKICNKHAPWRLF